LAYEGHRIILGAAGNSGRKHRDDGDDMFHADRQPIRLFEFDVLTMIVGAISGPSRPTRRG
jgi:hypothetical protein